MPAKRGPTRALPAGADAPPLQVAAILTAALGYSLYLLVNRGRLSWPPHELLNALATVCGCLALAGPLVLGRRGGDPGLGEQFWMMGGLLLWVYNLAAVARGDWRPSSWSSPPGVPSLGLTILAAGLASWRLR